MQRDFQTVRYKSGKHHFEVLCHPGTVNKYREGKIGWDNTIYTETIFTNQSKGLRANEADLEEVFGTSDELTVAKKIVEDGEVHLTAKERKEKVDKRRAEMVNYIHKYYMDPRTKTPHPVTRIENALDQLSFTIDPHMSAERQLQDKVLKRLPEVLPIKKSELEGTLIGLYFPSNAPKLTTGRKLAEYFFGNCISQFLRKEPSVVTNFFSWRICFDLFDLGYVISMSCLPNLKQIPL